MTLHSLSYGTDGPLVVFCHGLFGQGKNWGTVAKLLSDSYRCVLLDMPNHGRSPWTDPVDYPTMADAVAEHLATELACDVPVALVGHSMGGKIAMRIALTRPELVGRLAVVDMAPGETERMTYFHPIFDALNALPLDRIERRQEADDLLAEKIPDASVRALLMQSLHNDHGRWHWTLNLEGLTRDMAKLSAWPQIDATYERPTIFIGGADSDYITPADTPAIRALFPSAVKVKIKDAGHWVHSQRPDAFTATLRSFLDQTNPAAGTMGA